MPCHLRVSMLLQNHHHCEAIHDTSVPALDPLQSLGHHVPDGELHRGKNPVHSVYSGVPVVPGTGSGILFMLTWCPQNQLTDEREPRRLQQPGSCLVLGVHGEL